MARKLTDEELGQRTRTMQRLRSERQRLRMQESGKTALTVWIDAGIKAALNKTAIDRGATIADTATALLSAALTTTTQTTTTTRASNDAAATVDMFGDADTALGGTEPARPVLTQAQQADRDQQILELHRQGLSNYAVAEKAGCSEATIRRTLKRYNPESNHD